MQARDSSSFAHIETQSVLRGRRHCRAVVYRCWLGGRPEPTPLQIVGLTGEDFSNFEAILNTQSSVASLVRGLNSEVTQRHASVDERRSIGFGCGQPLFVARAIKTSEYRISPRWKISGQRKNPNFGVSKSRIPELSRQAWSQRVLIKDPPLAARFVANVQKLSILLVASEVCAPGEWKAKRLASAGFNGQGDGVKCKSIIKVSERSKWRGWGRLGRKHEFAENDLRVAK